MQMRSTWKTRKEVSTWRECTCLDKHHATEFSRVTEVESLCPHMSVTVAEIESLLEMCTRVVGHRFLPSCLLLVPAA